MFIDFIINSDYISARWIKRYINFILHFEYKKGHKHHILPKSIFPEFSNLKMYPWNCKILSPRAHYIAHYILSKAYGNKMLYAFNMLSNSCNAKINSRLYESAKREYSYMLSKFMSTNNPMFNEETRDKVSKSNTGKKASLATREKMSKNSYMKTAEGKYKKSVQMKKNNPMFKEIHRMTLSKAKMGSKHTIEAKLKMSISKKGVNTGEKHFRTRPVIIYNKYGGVMFLCVISFQEYCKSRSLPYKIFNLSYKNKEGFKSRKISYKEYEGWKVKKLKVTNVWSVTPQLNNIEE